MKIGMNANDLRMKEVKQILSKQYEVCDIQDQYYDVIVVGVKEQIDIASLYKHNPNLIVIDQYINDPYVKKIGGEICAYGVLQYLIEHLQYDLKTYKYTIIGYGACGCGVASLFKQLQLTYDIIRHHEVNEKVIDGDIIIYTAKKQVFSKQQIEQFKTKMIIDLSGTYLNNSIYLSKIPSKIAYKTSAEAISKVIKEKIYEKTHTLWD